MARLNVRVVIPTNPEKLLDLADLVNSKHTADAATSPLLALADHNWSDNGPRLTEARDIQRRIKQLEKDVENLYKQRDLLVKPVDATVRASRDLLLSAYRTNPKKLGEWGFEVNDTPQKKK